MSGVKTSDLYRDVTSRIIAELEQGRVPWVQPWGQPGINTPLGLPQNAATGNLYSGINILLLWGAAIEHGRASQSWLTFKQAKVLGGSVRKSERGSMVVYADRFIPKAEARRAASEGDDPQAVPFLKRYTVFNIAQCEGLPEGIGATAPPVPACEQVEEAEQLIAATGADFRIGGHRAFYVPSQDFIQLPPQPAFFEPIDYYRTCFREPGHWSGHETRLNRKLSTKRGSKPYARDELVAEMTSAFLCARLPITPTVRHADYIGSWLEVLLLSCARGCRSPRPSGMSIISAHGWRCCARITARFSPPPAQPPRPPISF